MSKHELVLVFDARVDEIAEQSALDAVIRLGRIVDRPIWQTAPDQAVSVVAAAGMTLTRDRLPPWSDAPHGRADTTTQIPGIAGGIRVNIFEIIESVGTNY